MQIRLRNNQLEIKTGQATINLTNRALIINGRSIDSSGEYEVAGVEVFGLPSGLFVLRAEQILLCLGEVSQEWSSPPKDEVLSDSEVMILAFSGQELLKLVVDLIKAVDPQVIIPLTDQQEAFCKLIGGCGTSQMVVKLSKATLPTDSQQVMLLGHES
jgi:hypothetical protein